MSFAVVCALALQQQAQIKHISAANAKMDQEIAVFHWPKSAATSARLSIQQKSQVEEAIDEDLESLVRKVAMRQAPAALQTGG